LASSTCAQENRKPVETEGSWWDWEDALGKQSVEHLWALQTELRFGKPEDEAYLGNGVAGIAGVAEALKLVRGGVDQVGVAVAEGVDGHARGHVEVLAPVDVIELAAAPGHENDLGAFVGAHDVLGLVLHDGSASRGQLPPRRPRGRRGRRRRRRGRVAGGDARPPI
jgi:hypothetical protein